MSDAPASPAKKPRVRPDSPAPLPPADALVKPSIQIELADEDDDDESDDPDAPPHRPSLKPKDDAARYQLAIARAKAIHARRVRLLACGYAPDEPGVDDGYTGQHFSEIDTDYESASESEYASDGVIGSNGRLRV